MNRSKLKPIWSGAIVFGLVQVPVNLYSAVRESRLNLRLLHKKDLCPIEMTRVCRKTGEEIPYEQIVRGYEYQKGEYLVLSDKDLEKVRVWNPKTIEILQFADEREIEPKYYEKPYYLGPAAEDKPYALFREALRRSGKVGVARFVIASRERLGIVRGEAEALVLNQIRYNWEVRQPEGLRLPGVAEMKVGELDQAVKLINFLSQPLRIEQFEDIYIRELRQAIEVKLGALPTGDRVKGLSAGTKQELLEKLENSLEEARNEI
jgi:DNA end-binding protein Ku